VSYSKLLLPTINRVLIFTDLKERERESERERERKREKEGWGKHGGGAWWFFGIYAVGVRIFLWEFWDSNPRYPTRNGTYRLATETAA
jgi:hypothetical protein